MENFICKTLTNRFINYPNELAFCSGKDNFQKTNCEFVNDVCNGILWLEKHNLIGKNLAYFSYFGKYDEIVNLTCICIVSRLGANYYLNKPLEAVLSDLSNENTWDGIFAPKNLLNPNNGLKNVFSNEFYENESIKLNNEQIIKILNNPIYINNSPMIGSSSNGSTSPNHHWTYHNLDEFF